MALGKSIKMYLTVFVATTCIYMVLYQYHLSQQPLPVTDFAKHINEAIVNNENINENTIYNLMNIHRNSFNVATNDDGVNDNSSAEPHSSSRTRTLLSQYILPQSATFTSLESLRTLPSLSSSSLALLSTRSTSPPTKSSSISLIPRETLKLLLKNINSFLWSPLTLFRTLKPLNSSMSTSTTPLSLTSSSSSLTASSLTASSSSSSSSLALALKTFVQEEKVKPNSANVASAAHYDGASRLLVILFQPFNATFDSISATLVSDINNNDSNLVTTSTAHVTNTTAVPAAIATATTSTTTTTTTTPTFAKINAGNNNRTTITTTTTTMSVTPTTLIPNMRRTTTTKTTTATIPIKRISSSNLQNIFLVNNNASATAKAVSAAPTSPITATTITLKKTKQSKLSLNTTAATTASTTTTPTPTLLTKNNSINNNVAKTGNSSSISNNNKNNEKEIITNNINYITGLVRRQQQHQQQHQQQQQLHKSIYRMDNRKSQSKLVPPPLYIITPTYRRPEQLPELTRLGYTLKHITNLLWLVIEDANTTKSHMVINTLNRIGVPYEYFLAPMPEEYKKHKIKPRGVSNRNRGLQWLRVNATDGAFYFADDDNTYDITIFEQMRYTKKVSMWPVGLVTKLGISSPIVKHGKLVGFYDGWIGGRKYPVDMAGFAISVHFLHQRPKAKMPFKAGYEEDGFLKSLAPLDNKDIELLANNCTEILTWHTQTKSNRPADNLNVAKYGDTNLVHLDKQLVRPLKK